MILSYNELRKREVVNIADGRSFGKITDLKLEFPRGILKGIVVNEGRKSGLIGFFCKNGIFIDEKNIVRIGGDVILVNLKNCAATVSSSVDMSGNSPNKPQKPSPTNPVCPPPPLPPCPPPPPVNPCAKITSDSLFSESENADFEDY